MPAAHLLQRASRVSSIVTTNAHRRISPGWPTITISTALHVYTPFARKPLAFLDRPHDTVLDAPLKLCQCDREAALHIRAQHIF